MIASVNLEFEPPARVNVPDLLPDGTQPAFKGVRSPRKVSATVEIVWWDDEKPPEIMGAIVKESGDPTLARWYAAVTGGKG